MPELADSEPQSCLLAGFRILGGFTRLPCTSFQWPQHQLELDLKSLLGQLQRLEQAR